MSDELIREKDARISLLESQLKDVRDEAAKKRTQNTDLKAQVEKLTGERDTIQAERDTLASRAEAKPQALQLKIDELTGKLRTTEHKFAVKDKAIESGVKPEAFEAFWKLLDFKPDSDEVDQAAVEEVVMAGKAAHSYLFKGEEVPGATNTSPPPPPLPPGHGSARGRTPPTYTMRATQAQLADPAWCMANSKAKADAVKAGTFQLIE